LATLVKIFFALVEFCYLGAGRLQTSDLQVAKKHTSMPREWAANAVVLGAVTSDRYRLYVHFNALPKEQVSAASKHFIITMLTQLCIEEYFLLSFAI
jgi:hypothetical protein